MKKFFYAVSVLSLFVFMSCQQPTDSTGNNTDVTKWGSLEAQNLYQEYLGTWELDENEKSGTYYDGTPKYNGIDSLVFSNNYVMIDSIKYAITSNNLVCAKDYFGPYHGLEGFPGEYYLDGGGYYWSLHYDKEKTLLIKIDDRLLEITFRSWSYYKKNEIFVLWNSYDVDPTYNSFFRVTNSDNEESASSVNGTYAFNNATGSQSNGTITLSDGNFTYSGSKSNAPSGGTYTVSGSDITFTWTASGYTVNTTVTMSKNSSSVTFSSSEVVFFSTFFGSTDQSGGKYSLTFSYSE